MNNSGMWILPNYKVLALIEIKHFADEIEKKKKNLPLFINQFEAKLFIGCGNSGYWIRDTDSKIYTGPSKTK